VSSLTFNVMSPDAERYLVTISGDLCWPDADQLWHRLDTLINRGVLLVLDLANIELADSRAVRTLLLAQRAAAERRATLRLAAPSAQLSRLLARGGVDDLFDTRPDAVSALLDHSDDAAPSNGSTAAEFSNQSDD
jgi:anti-anti-sigma factor